MNASHVCLTVEAGIARVTLTRAEKRNALTREFLLEITQAIRTVAADKHLRVLQFAAEGPVFCAGMDLAQMQQRAQSPNAVEEWREDTRVYRDLLVSLLELTVPTLAVVQGPALAGGFGLLLACDMVVAAESAQFSLPEPKRGITAAIVAPLLIHRIGQGRATYVLLSGRMISSETALQWGICHEVVRDQELDQHARELTAFILEGSPASLAMTKDLLAAQSRETLLQQIDFAMQVSAQARETLDAREGLAAFLERRQPSWYLTRD